MDEKTPANAEVWRRPREAPGDWVPPSSEVFEYEVAVTNLTATRVAVRLIEHQMA